VWCDARPHRDRDLRSPRLIGVLAEILLDSEENRQHGDRARDGNASIWRDVSGLL